MSFSSEKRFIVSVLIRDFFIVFHSPLLSCSVIVKVIAEVYQLQTDISVQLPWSSGKDSWKTLNRCLMYCSGIKSFSLELKMLERRVRNSLPSSINQGVLVNDCMGVYTGWYILACLLEDKGWDHLVCEQSSFCHFWIRFDPDGGIPLCSHKIVKFKPCSCVPILS